jgi:hypothetical protein
MRIPADLSEALFEIRTAEQTNAWLIDVSDAIGGIAWTPLGGIDNNVHTVEVASDPALALVERPINGIDALLDLRARELGETTATPHEAASRWWGVPTGGLAEMDERERRSLGQLLRVTMLESGEASRPTVTVQDQGTGQHPEDFPDTLLSLLASNKKTTRHQMGVYNAGGAASCRFARATVVASRLAPSLLAGRLDETGVSVIRYDPLDPERYKSGSYVYLTAKDGSILRLDLTELPGLPFGTYVKLVEYELSKYARAAQEPKSSLWHLFNAALPSPPLPLQVVETRSERFTGVRGQERRTIAGILHLLSRPGTADYSDVRQVDLGPDVGNVTLRYFVLNEGVDPDAYTTSDQGLTITLNGQRQLTKDRLWVRRNLELPFLYKRLVIVVDGSALSNATKRDVFSSTRESGVDTPAARLIVDRVVEELREDEGLFDLDELARQRVLEDATRTTTERVKRQLASQIAAFLEGELPGSRGGAARTAKRPPRPRPPRPVVPVVDDSLMLDVPDKLVILTDPVKIKPGATAALHLEINAKNDFLPRHSDGLSVVVGPELASDVRVRSKGRLLGGHVRITLEATTDAAEGTAMLRVALVVPELGVLLTADGQIAVSSVDEKTPAEDKKRGGEPDIEVQWIGRDKWGGLEPPWDAETVGRCDIHREDGTDVISRVDFILNEDFGPYAQVISTKTVGEDAMRRFRESYEYPVLFALFKQRLAEEAKEREADEGGATVEIPDDYVRGEQARMARAVLMAMEPEIRLSEAVDAAA